MRPRAATLPRQVRKRQVSRRDGHRVGDAIERDDVTQGVGSAERLYHMPSSAVELGSSLQSTDRNDVAHTEVDGPTAHTPSRLSRPPIIGLAAVGLEHWNTCHQATANRQPVTGAHAFQLWSMQVEKTRQQPSEMPDKGDVVPVQRVQMSM